jgi:hypothetical protein
MKKKLQQGLEKENVSFENRNTNWVRQIDISYLSVLPIFQVVKFPVSLNKLGKVNSNQNVLFSSE